MTETHGSDKVQQEDKQEPSLENMLDSLVAQMSEAPAKPERVVTVTEGEYTWTFEPERARSVATALAAIEIAASSIRQALEEQEDPAMLKRTISYLAGTIGYARTNAVGQLNHIGAGDGIDGIWERAREHYLQHLADYMEPRN